MKDKELTQIFEEERSNIGLEDVSIDLAIPSKIPNNQLSWKEFSKEWEEYGSIAKRNQEGCYKCQIHKGCTFDPDIFRKKVRHELYHIYAGHCDRTPPISFLSNLLLDIPTLIYEHSKINLSKIKNSFTHPSQKE